MVLLFGKKEIERSQKSSFKERRGWAGKKWKNKAGGGQEEKTVHGLPPSTAREGGKECEKRQQVSSTYEHVTFLYQKRVEVCEFLSPSISMYTYLIFSHEI